MLPHAKHCLSWLSIIVTILPNANRVNGRLACIHAAMHYLLSWFADMYSVLRICMPCITLHKLHEHLLTCCLSSLSPAFLMPGTACPSWVVLRVRVVLSAAAGRPVPSLTSLSSTIGAEVNLRLPSFQGKPSATTQHHSMVIIKLWLLMIRTHAILPRQALCGQTAPLNATNNIVTIIIMIITVIIIIITMTIMMMMMIMMIMVILIIITIKMHASQG